MDQSDLVVLRIRVASESSSGGVAVGAADIQSHHGSQFVPFVMSSWWLLTCSQASGKGKRRVTSRILWTTSYLVRPALAKTVLAERPWSVSCG